jgi:hypothetical protein
MALYDAMHPRCREAIREAPYNFDLTTLPRLQRWNAIPGPDRDARPKRFIAFLQREIARVRADAPLFAQVAAE